MFAEIEAGHSEWIETVVVVVRNFVVLFPMNSVPVKKVYFEVQVSVYQEVDQDITDQDTSVQVESEAVDPVV